jgi:ABC-type Zn uptake system ZnuABC Zn-binding protein ZnuA
LPRIPVPISENAIIAELERIANASLYLEDIHAELLQRYQASKSTIEERAAEMRNKLRKIYAQITNITNAIADTGHSNALLKRLSELETDQLIAENLLVELQQQEQPRPVELANISDVMKKKIN